jgi:hypothetical protein
MAEIKIEKKKPMWPWVLVVAIIVGLIIYFLVYNTDQERREVTPERDEIAPREATPRNTVKLETRKTYYCMESKDDGEVLNLNGFVGYNETGVI